MALTRGGVSLLSTEGLGTMEEQVTTNYKEFSRQGGVNITAPLPRGRRHHHRLGRRSPHPLPSSKPAGEQRGGEQPGRRSLEGVGGAKGVSGKIFGCFLSRSLIHNFSCAVVWPALPTHQASAGRIGRDELNESESFITEIVCLVSFILSA